MGAAASGVTPEQYIESRVRTYQAWYDGKAVTCKRRYLRMRAFAVIAGGIVPVLVNVEASVNNFVGYPITKAVITAVSLLVVISVSLESVYHYREQWKNYRSTEQFLGREQFEFMARVGPYKGLEDTRVFKLFVERIENAISSENAATLNVLSVGADTTHNK